MEATTGRRVAQDWLQGADTGSLSERARLRSICWIQKMRALPAGAPGGGGGQLGFARADEMRRQAGGRRVFCLGPPTLLALPNASPSAQARASLRGRNVGVHSCCCCCCLFLQTIRSPFTVCWRAELLPLCAAQPSRISSKSLLPIGLPARDR